MNFGCFFGGRVTSLYLRLNLDSADKLVTFRGILIYNDGGVAQLVRATES